MAPLTARSGSTDLDLFTTTPQRVPHTTLPTPVSSAASESDKENERHSSGKRKSIPMAESIQEPPTQKRRRIGERTSGHESSVMDKKYYDPDQDPQQRRRTKKGMRDLYSKLNDSKAEFVQAESRGLIDTLTQADRFYKNVKQTADATVDSRILVTAADLSLKKVKKATLGDSSVSVDVDDFVSKCIAFMRRGDHDLTAAETQQLTQRRRQGEDHDPEESGDTMNWNYLGRKACFLYNSRPCLSGFLLGPLSVRKKVRQQTQRRGNDARQVPSQLLRPIELSNEDLEKQESASLSQICKEIAVLLQQTCLDRQTRLEEEYNANDQWSEEETRAKMHEYGLADDGGISLFEFCVNPKSFGQTVENMFYVSFLIKESTAGLGFDSDGLPTLQPCEQRSLAERQQTQRNQAVFTLSFDVWEQIVDTFGIEKSIIPHRDDQVFEDGAGTLSTPGLTLRILIYMADALPISAASFAQAIEDLPMENLYAKASEINNSIAHLQRSNAELKEYIINRR
ncbi:hypothetical protein DV738_g5522, partial [Chaetothyriales sp. CBS 135597]